MVRTVVGDPIQCGLPDQEEMCNTQSCNSPNCIYSSWSGWSSCEGPCSDQPLQFSTRSVIGGPSGCASSSPLMSSMLCSNCTNCEYDQVRSISDCSARCGGGTQRFTRSVTGNSSEVCEQWVNVSMPCNTQSCSCGLSSWTAWSVCNQNCSHYRTRSVISNASQCGGAVLTDQEWCCGVVTPLTPPTPPTPSTSPPEEQGIAMYLVFIAGSIGLGLSIVGTMSILKGVQKVKVSDKGVLDWTSVGRRRAKYSHVDEDTFNVENEMTDYQRQ